MNTTCIILVLAISSGCCQRGATGAAQKVGENQFADQKNFSPPNLHGANSRISDHVDLRFLNLLSLRTNYIHQEGEKRRGVAFGRLAAAVAVYVFDKKEISEGDMFLILGHPDYFRKPTAEKPGVYLYLYNESSDSSAGVLIDMNSNGVVSRVGFSSLKASEIESQFAYPAWPPAK
jgi:hypothetical protein